MNVFTLELSTTLFFFFIFFLQLQSLCDPVMAVMLPVSSALSIGAMTSCSTPDERCG